MKKNHLLLEINNGVCTDLVCFSHLRWNFVYQRPQHLISRFAQQFRTYYVEEPVYHDGEDSFTKILTEEKVWVITPLLNSAPVKEISIHHRQKNIINNLFSTQKIENFIAWYYTPMALKISSHLKPLLIVYDCMDELSAFKFAPAELKIMEAELISKAQVMFTGGYSLYKSKRNLHNNIYSFPSSIDKAHFIKGRKKQTDPADQATIPHTRLGFFGVIDERFNINLIKQVAKMKPEWQLILIGPVVKIDPASLPRLQNIHYLGCKSYNELPGYLAGWDIAMIPFEKNDSTKFISPTKTPEYLAAGKPVISASITDVVSPYGDNKLVYIADTAAEFIEAAEKELKKTTGQRRTWLQQVDAFLENVSWDFTYNEMVQIIAEGLIETGTIQETKDLKSVA